MILAHNSALPETTIAGRVASLGDWITGFMINGVRYGGHYNPDTDDRLWLFIEKLNSLANSPADILECGCLEGGHTITLAKTFPSATIHAVDVRPENLAKAKLLTELTESANVTFLQDDFDAPAICFQRNYDAVFCVGLLYHLRWPQEFLRQACSSSPILWLWTVYCDENEIATMEEKHRGRIYIEPKHHPLSAVREESFFPSLGSLIEFIWEAGYTHIELVRKEMTKNGNGPAVMLCATRATRK
ncbi:MAG: class I SAM-dependent methyltransferase [Opitutaceae bacterium]